MTFDDVIASHKPKMASDVLLKADVVVGSMFSQRVAGSMEHFIGLATPALIAGCGCESKPPVIGNDLCVPYGANYHYPMVVATFDDRGIVSCDQCQQHWEIPFNVEGDGEDVSISTGTPVIVENAFIKPGEVAASDDDGDEVEVVTD